MNPKPTPPIAYFFVWVTLSFWVLAPLCTFELLLLKGLPSFAEGYRVVVLLWIYQVTWLPALVSGLLVSAVLVGLRPRLDHFLNPFDIGRCFSLGVITGALAEALSTWAYRAMSQRPFSSFWIAGAMIAGALAGAAIVTFLLWRIHLKKNLTSLKRQV